MIERHAWMICRVLTVVSAVVSTNKSLAIDGLFVGSDNAMFDSRVHHYDAQSGDLVKVFGSDEHRVMGMTFGPDRMLYVADSLAYRAVVRYDPATGNLLKVFSREGNVDFVYDLAIGPDGDLYACANASVYRYDLATGEWKGEFLPSGAGGQGMAFMPGGDLLVAQRGGVISRYDGHTGEFVGIFVYDPDHDRPWGIRYGPDGNLYVPDRETKFVHRYNGLTGEYMGVFAAAQWEARGIAFGPNGNLFVADLNFVTQFDGTSGAYLGVFAGSWSQQELSSLVFGPVPEPATLTGVFVGLLALARTRRR